MKCEMDKIKMCKINIIVINYDKRMKNSKTKQNIKNENERHGSTYHSDMNRV